MSQSLKTLLKLSAAAMSLSLVVGCASNGGAEGEMEAQIQEAQQAAMDAQTTADEAKAEAEAALSAANEAKELAKNANGLAKSAQFTADQNAEKIDRMFKKSMYK